MPDHDPHYLSDAGLGWTNSSGRSAATTPPMGTADRPRPNNVKSSGAIYTPAVVAEALTRFLGPDLCGETTVLEPSVGDGAFIDALLSHGVPSRHLTGVDLDASVVGTLAQRLPEARFIAQDFLDFAEANPAKFKVIVGNPPYVRARNLPAGSAAKFDALAARTSYPRSDLKNLWAAFVVAADDMLTGDGTLALILPYELLHVDYGARLLEHLAKRFSRLEIVVSEQKTFPGIDQDAVALIARRRSAHPGTFIHRVTSLESLGRDDTEQPRPFVGSWQNRTVPKSFLVDDDALAIAERLAGSSTRFRSLCDNTAGIVTAANSFFIVDDDKLDTHGLRPWAKPIVRRSGMLGPGPVLSAAAYETMRARHPAYVLDLGGLEPANEPAAIRDYLAIGIRLGANMTYKAQNRKPWFDVKVPQIADGFFFKRSHSIPRLCVNEARVHATDAAYLLRPAKGHTMRGICFSFYNSFTLLFAELMGRFYGGGVLELTPNELRQLPMIYTEPDDAEFSGFAEIGRWSDPRAIAKAGDAFLVKRHGVDKRELEHLHEAWWTVRAHRLRHG